MSEDARLARSGVTGSTQEPKTVSLPERLLWFAVLTTAHSLGRSSNPWKTGVRTTMSTVRCGREGLTSIGIGIGWAYR